MHREKGFENLHGKMQTKITENCEDLQILLQIFSYRLRRWEHLQQLNWSQNPRAAKNEKVLAY